MENTQTLTVHDISTKLGVHPYTVKRWIVAGKLKGKKENCRLGYKIKVCDFEKFLDENPAYRSIESENLPYEKARVDICKDLMIGLYELQRSFLAEEHGKTYSEGWNDAIEKFDKLIKSNLVDSY